MPDLSAMTRGELDEAIRMEVAGMRHCDGCRTTMAYRTPNGPPVEVSHGGPHLHWPDPLTGAETVVAPSCTFLDADGTLNVLQIMRIRGFVVSLRGVPPQVPFYRDDGDGHHRLLPITTPRWVASFTTPLNDDPPWIDEIDFDENPALAVGRGALRAIREQAHRRRP